MFKKSQKVPTFNFFRFTRQSQTLSLHLLLHFALYPNFGRNILTISRFTKKEAEVQKQALPFGPTPYIRTSEAFSEHEKHHLEVRNFLFVSLSFKKSS